MQQYLKKINRNLLPLKICMFLWWGGHNALFVYMAVHMKSLGLTIRQTGVIHSVLPIVQVSGQLGMGTVADRLKKHKFILVTSLVSAVAFATGILFIPSVERSSMTQDPTTDEEEVLGSTFYTYLFLRLFFELCASTVYNLFESTGVLLVAQNPESNFGSQRIFATIGAGIFPVVAGKLLDAFSGDSVDQRNDTLAFDNTTDNGLQVNPEQDYSVLFYLFDAMAIATMLVAFVFLRIDPQKRESIESIDKEAQSPWKSLLKIALKPECAAFVLTIFCLGTFWGYTKVYIPWRMAELGSDQFLIGMNLFLSTALGFVLVLFSAKIIRTIGHVPVMTLSLVAYFVRFLAYSFITIPEYFLIFEALEGITFHLLWIACVTYAALLTPVSLTATVQGFLGSVHYCVGIGVGGLIGGTAISDFGPEMAFRGMSIGALCCALTSGAFYFGYTRRFSAISL